MKYSNFLDAFAQILTNERPKILFTGTGANVLRAVVGAGLLGNYDRLVVFKKKNGIGGV